VTTVYSNHTEKDAVYPPVEHPLVTKEEVMPQAQEANPGLVDLAIPGVYQMRTLQHMSRTLADEEARFRQASAWIERLEDTCRHVATEALGLAAILQQERNLAISLAEEISTLSHATLAAWPVTEEKQAVILTEDDIDVTTSSFFTDRDEQMTAEQQKTESFQEMWEQPPVELSRRSRRRLGKSAE
jgi:hypothetical protein